MKTLRNLLVLLFLTLVIGIHAQDKTAKDYKLEGFDAYKAKNYEAGLEFFEKAIDLYEQEGKNDTALYYNAGVCSYKTQKFDKAVSYFNQSLGFGYKTCNALLYKANSLKKLEKYEEMEIVCDKGVTKCSKAADKFNDLLFKYYLNSGLTIYNNASILLTEASKYIQSDQEKYNSEMVAVKTEFTNSLPLLEKAYELNPDDENCKKALKQTYEVLEMQAKAAGL